ncbi:MAG: hypothetical protein OEV40_27925 [Acidimicrobiia bacterium]|nr:hypothetical protein [Acidimicrobiia bacterium]
MSTVETASVASPPRPTAPSVARRPTVPAGLGAAAPQRSGTGVLDGWTTGTTPGWYRVAAAVAVASILAFAAIATAVALGVRSASQAIERDIAPSLIEVQNLFASVAEANAAATAVFLSGTTGTEDRGLRNLYLDALHRSAAKTEQVATLIGDDEASHEALQDLSAALTDYSGQIEASRVASRLAQPDADAALRSALDQTRSGIAPSVVTVTERGQDQLDEKSSSGVLATVAVIAAGLVALGALGWLQVGTYRRSNRVLNIPLVIATLAVVASLVAVAWGSAVRSTAIDNARGGGFDSIVNTSRLQTSAFDLQSELSFRLLGSEDRDVTALATAIDAEVGALRAQADSRREDAAAAELEQRWVRYRSTMEEITALAGRDRATAIERFRGPGLSTFNGFNTSIESVLSDNRTQFLGGVEQAADATNLIPVATVLLPVAAMLAVVVGVQRRLGDYQ